jgi:hypothetical protein
MVQKREEEIMKRMFHALVVLVTFSIVIFHGPLGAVASGKWSPPPIKVVVVSGTNYEMGVQYGEQAAELIAVNRDVVWEILDTEVVDPITGVPLDRTVIEKDIQVWTYYQKKYDPGLTEWFLGISQGCKNKGFEVSYADLVALMVYPQEVWARPGMEYPPETGVVAVAPSKNSTLLAAARTDIRPRSSCTAFTATGTATPGGVPMVSITGGAMLEVTKYVILIAFPKDGERFIALTDAGRIANNVGMNSKFGWVMPAAVNNPWLPCASSWGVTSEVYFHYLMQYPKSVVEAVKYLDETPKGGVTGLFLFADHSGEAFIYEGGFCGSAIRKPGDLGENKDFVVSTNHYNSPSMAPYNLPAEWFPDTYVRYATAFEKLSSAQPGTVGVDFAKTLWAANDWYDASTGEWHTVVPNDFSDVDPTNDTPYVCYVPGNLCEGGEYQIIQLPAQKTAYLQLGVPQGTSIQYYWPDDPKPTGEYTKWQLLDSITKVASAASDDAGEMIKAAWDAFWQKARLLDPATRNELRRLMNEATQAWRKGRMEEIDAEHAVHGHRKGNKKTEIVLWSAALTDYATAQLCSQMVTTKLKQY